MRKNILINKKSQSELLTTILSLIIISSSVLLGTNLTMNGSIIEGDHDLVNIIEKTSEIEIFADTLLELEINNYSLEALLLLDNGTSLSGQEIEFYLNASLIESSLTNTEGYANFNFTLYNTSPGTYSLIVGFQGSNSSYLNPSYTEKLIEITESNGTKQITRIEQNKSIIKIPGLNETNVTVPVLNGTNLTILNDTNFTILTNITNTTKIILVGCKSFEEQVLWSSGYTHDKKGSTNYQKWYPEHNCSEIGKENCFLGDIKSYSRLVSTGSPEDFTEGYGYAQISLLNNCDNPENGEYSGYLTYDKVNKEEIKKGNYCEKGKDEECDIGNYYLANYSNCYGIKAYGSQYLILDVFSVNYTLCEYGFMTESGGEENEF